MNDVLDQMDAPNPRSSRRRRRWAGVGVALLVILAASLLLPACCCPDRPQTVSTVPRPSPPPPIGRAHFDVPAEAVPADATQAEFHRVHFRVDETIALRIHRLRGEMQDKNAGEPLNFDDKGSFVLRIHYGEIGLTGEGLTDLMNEYLFAYEGAPLRDLSIVVEEGQLIQTGIMHKIIDIPFRMVADVSVTDDGRIRIHPTEIEICNLDGESLMAAFGLDLEEMLDLGGAEGVAAEGNDLLIDALAVIPGMTTEGRLTAVEAHQGELLQIFGTEDEVEWMIPPITDEPNWMFFREGTLRMGKLYMPRAEMQVIDTDPADWFDFFLDYYNNQLSAAMSKNRPDYGLQVYMRDWEDLGAPLRPAERLMPVGTLEPRE